MINKYYDLYFVWRSSVFLIRIISSFMFYYARYRPMEIMEKWLSKPTQGLISICPHSVLFLVFCWARNGADHSDNYHL